MQDHSPAAQQALIKLPRHSSPQIRCSLIMTTQAVSVSQEEPTAPCLQQRPRRMAFPLSTFLVNPPCHPPHKLILINARFSRPFSLGTSCTMAVDAGWSWPGLISPRNWACRRYAAVGVLDEVCNTGSWACRRFVAVFSHKARASSLAACCRIL